MDSGWTQRTDNDENPPDYSTVAKTPEPNPFSTIRIPIRASELEAHDLDHPDVPNPLVLQHDRQRRAWHPKISINKPDPDIRFVPMTRVEYRAYWEKDPSTTSTGGTNGAMYCSHVVDPPGGRKAWVQQQLEAEEEWRQAMTALDPAQKAQKSPNAFAKYAAQHVAQVGLVATTGPFGVAAIWAGDRIRRRSKSG